MSITHYCIRYYSTFKKASRLWVKHNACPPTKVSIKSCADIDDLAKKVRQDLNINCQVALCTSLEKEPIHPWLKINDLLKTEFKNNSGETPLFVKIIPAIQESIATKTIHVAEINEDGELTGSYKQRILRNDHDLMKVIKDGQGLIHLSSPENVLISIDDIKNGEKYHIYKFAQNFPSWQA
jgi:hypothetical protein